MRIVTLVLAGLLGCAATAASGQGIGVQGTGANGQTAAQAPAPAPLLSSAPPAPDARWSFRRVDDGFVRLDNSTGQVAHCTPVHSSWACQAVPQNPAALEKQVAALRAEVESLKQEIARLQAAPPPPPAPPPPAPQGPAVSLRMPTHEELARAGTYVADTLSASWHRLVEMIMHFQHDVLRKDS